MEVPAGDVAEVADHLPALAENRLLLGLEELRIVVNPGRQAQVLKIILGGSGDALQLGGFHGGPGRRVVVERSYNKGSALRNNRPACRLGDVWYNGPQ